MSLLCSTLSLAISRLFPTGQLQQISGTLQLPLSNSQVFSPWTTSLCLLPAGFSVVCLTPVNTEQVHCLHKPIQETLNSFYELFVNPLKEKVCHNPSYTIEVCDTTVYFSSFLLQSILDGNLRKEGLFLLRLCMSKGHHGRKAKTC